MICHKEFLLIIKNIQHNNFIYFWHLVMQTCFFIISLFSRASLCLHVCFMKDCHACDDAHINKQ